MKFPYCHRRTFSNVNFVIIKNFSDATVEGFSMWGVGQTSTRRPTEVNNEGFSKMKSSLYVGPISFVSQNQGCMIPVRLKDVCGWSSQMQIQYIPIRDHLLGTNSIVLTLTLASLSLTVLIQIPSSKFELLLGNFHEWKQLYRITSFSDGHTSWREAN